MRLEGEQTLLRVYLRSTDKQGWFSAPAAETLVASAKTEGMSGATVLRGIMGLDIAGQLLESSPWSVAECLPVIVEFVDIPQAIGRFLTTVASTVKEGIATLERGHVLLYRQSRASELRARMRLSMPGPVEPFSTLPSPDEFPIMKSSEEGRLLRVFIGESDVWQGEPLYRAIVMKARELGLAGATVLRGPMGFGANSRMHTTKLLELSTDLPIVIEIVDTAEKLEPLFPFLDDAVLEGLITIEGVRVLRYRASEGSPAT
jgi:uncharacterized protein